MRQRRHERSIHANPTHEGSDPFSRQQEEENYFPKSTFFSSSMNVFVLCLAFRMANSLLIQTYFNPDEHWQALEVAHHIVFGYGHLTWEWKTGIRSYLHPLVFAALYKVLALLGLDTPCFMVLVIAMFLLVTIQRQKAHGCCKPCFLQLVIYTCTKFLMLSWGNQWQNGQYPLMVQLFYLIQHNLLSVSLTFETRRPGCLLASPCYHYTYSCTVMSLTILQLFCQLSNWFVFFCFNRTLSNSLETVLTLVGLYYWPCMRASPGEVPLVSRKWGLALAALACAIRPTSAITWVYVGLLELLVTHDRVGFIVLEVVPIGALVLGLSCLLDRLMYGSWIIVPLNFLKFNFLSSGGDYYGTHKWHWYFSQGFPVMLFTFLPFSIAGIIKSKQRKLFGLLLWVLILYSTLGHKEFRFVLPVLPIALLFSGYSLAVMARSDSLDRKRKDSSNNSTKWPSKVRFAIFFLLATNIPMALYMSLVHQRGTEDVMIYLSKEASNKKVKSILFLMPCHATPYYSTLHSNLPMHFLDCSPSKERKIPDESDRFLMDPVGYVSEMAKNWSLPSHVVIFDLEERLLRDFLIAHSFKEIRRFFHAHFKVDRDLQSSVIVYALTD